MVGLLTSLRLKARSRLGREEGGQVIAFAAISLAAAIGMGAFVFDVGNYYRAHRQLQAAADAAAIAAAGQLPNVSAATTTAQQYSASAGDKNENANLSGVTTTVTTKCISGLPCNPANTVVVTETATVSAIFGKVLGIGSATITAKSTA